MKNLNLLLLLGIFLLTLACEKDNINITSIEELPQAPTIVEVENALQYSLASSNTTTTPGSAYKIAGSVPSGASYFVASDDVTVDCANGTSFQSSFDGGDFFQLLFYGDEFGAQVILAGFDTVLDGDTISASNSFPTPNCPQPVLAVEYEEANGRLAGTVTGEFFKLADELVAPFDSCVNFVSVGILEASFDVAIISCN